MERRTRQRAALESMLDQTAGFHSAQQLHQMLEARGESVSRATVYRILQSLAQEGEVDVLRGQDNESRYRRCQRQEHHHHLVCRECGHAVDVAESVVESWAKRTARKHGYTSVSHTVELLGICANCAGNSKKYDGGALP